MSHFPFLVNPPLLTWAVVLLYGIGGMAVGTRGLNTVRRTYLVRQEGGAMWFRSPPALRRFWAGTSVFFGLMLISFVVTAYFLSDPRALCFEIPISLSLVLIFAYLAGHDDVFLDSGRRVYEHTCGWPWRPRTRTGPFDDLKGVCVTPRSAVLLVPRRVPWFKIGVMLSGPGLGANAQTLVEEVSRATGLPVIDYPQGRK